MKSIVLLKWGHLFSLCNILVSSVSVPGDRPYSGTLSGENKMCFLPLVTLLFLKCFSCCGTLVDFCPRGQGQRCSASLEEFPGDWEWTGFWPGSFILEEIRNQCNMALLIQKELRNKPVCDRARRFISI